MNLTSRLSTVHVEQFKEELTREVLGMTHEVGRLHRERQAVQNQIADLFAFYTKQQQAGEAVSVVLRLCLKLICALNNILLVCTLVA
jgi:hypothetical protein